MGGTGPASPVAHPIIKRAFICDDAPEALFAPDGRISRVLRTAFGDIPPRRRSSPEDPFVFPQKSAAASRDQRSRSNRKSKREKVTPDRTTNRAQMRRLDLPVRGSLRKVSTPSASNCRLIRLTAPSEQKRSGVIIATPRNLGVRSKVDLHTVPDRRVGGSAILPDKRLAWSDGVADTIHRYRAT